jgi:very-short-patch-repair endonuclease
MTRKRPPRDLTDLARRLRRDQTTPERLLWRRLRSGSVGAKFRRQVPIANYVVDFLCLRAGLVVEVDGDTHAGDEAEAEDRLRTRALKAHGLRVVRFSNHQIMEDLQGVLGEILTELSTPSPPPSPEGRGGKQLPPP